MKFNENQTRAIQATHKNVTVFASAGAGKTTLLIERLIKRMRDDKLKISEICAMTFTEAAASEMRKRLAMALSSQQDPHLKKQLPLLPNAHISTIHSFCLFIIKDYGYILGLNPKATSNIITDHKKKQMTQAAIELLKEEMAQTQADASLSLSEVFSSRPDYDGPLCDAIIDCAATLQEHPEPSVFIKQIKQIYGVSSLNQWPIDLQQAYWNYHTIWIDSIYHLSHDAFRAYDQDKINNEIELSSLNKLIHALQEARQLLEQQNSSFRDIVLSGFDLELKIVRNAPNYTAIRSELVKQIDRYVKDFYDEKTAFRQLNLLEPTASFLMECAQRFNEIYQSLKFKEAALDFNDLEHLALDILLAKDEFVSRLLKNQFKEIMVDEYQDTNPIQDRIISLISSGNNTFRVGDVKQSIYGFRGAKPDLMRSLIKIDSELSENIYLSHNYRSTHDIVHFNNLLFTRLMNIHTFKDAYTEHDFVETGLSSQNKDSVPVEIHELNLEDSDYSDNQAKALHIANQMIEFHRQGFDWREMVVLTRSHATKFELKHAFDRANIPYFIDERTGFYHANIVQDMLALLKLSIQRRDEYILVQVLASLYYQFSDEALAQLRLASKHDLYDNFKTLYPDLELELRIFLNKLSDLPLNKAMIELIQFRSIYHEHLNLQQKTNVDLLHEKALQFVGDGHLGILQFIQSIESLNDQESAQAIPVSSEDDVVNVMTIHQSKGLQYPVVFFWSNDVKRNLDLVNPWVIDLDFGLGLNFVELNPRQQRKSIIRELIEYKKRSEETEENIRLLYVALTRAQKRMVIVDVTLNKSATQLQPSMLFTQASFTHYLRAALQPSDDYVRFRVFTDLARERNNDIAKEVKFQPFPLPINFSKSEQPRASHRSSDNLNLDLNQAKRSSKAMEQGRLLHLVLETMKEVEWTQELLLKHFPLLNQRQIKLLLDYHQNPMTQSLYKQEHEHEFEFVVQYNQEPLYGIIDFISIHDNHLTLVDFKSDYGVTQDQLLQRHTHQILMYIEAMKTVYPDYVLTAYIYSFYLNTYIQVNLNEREADHGTN